MRAARPGRHVAVPLPCLAIRMRSSFSQIAFKREPTSNTDTRPYNLVDAILG